MRDKSLLIINYCMDESHPIFSWQYSVATNLALRFRETHVVTNSTGIISPESLYLWLSPWEQGRHFKNIVSLYYTLYKVLRRTNFQIDSVFFHMTDFHAALLAPVLIFFSRKRVLWYAHVANSLWLVISSLFMTSIATSTKYSFPKHPVKQPRHIGQAINEKDFSPSIMANHGLKFLHYGRLDPSKNIHLLIDFIKILRNSGVSATLTLVGSSSSKRTAQYFVKLLEANQDGIESGWLIISEAVPRSRLPELLRKHDYFVHAFQGSLDKSLVESTMCKIPVLTLNRAYIEEFGPWGDANCDLLSQYLFIQSLTPQSTANELDRRYRHALQNHSFSNWIQKIGKLLE